MNVLKNVTRLLGGLVNPRVGVETIVNANGVDIIENSEVEDLLTDVYGEGETPAFEVAIL